MKGYYTHDTYVEVEIPYGEILENLSDAELAEHGLMRVDAAVAQRIANVPTAIGQTHNLCSEGLTEHVTACLSARKAS